MKDTFGRTIDYLRISITDRCNYRCQYCMPEALPDVGHEAILRYEELMEICRAAVSCGITKFKVTGGEPFVRKGAVDFIAALKGLEGVRSVTVTTNGYVLTENLPKLVEAGIDGINISIDTLVRGDYQQITGVDGLDRVLEALSKAAASGIPVKVNVVLLHQTKDQLLALALLARTMPIDVRFIELMPIGCGRGQSGLSQELALAMLQGYLPDLRRVEEHRGNGPAVYYRSRELAGCIGFIGANSHPFCPACNRMRLTSMGLLKPCLCYEDGLDLRQCLRSGGSQEDLRKLFADAVHMKPKEHCFSKLANVTEHKRMNQIGG